MRVMSALASTSSRLERAGCTSFELSRRLRRQVTASSMWAQTLSTKDLEERSCSGVSLGPRFAYRGGEG
jgi:hypothetical protein